MTQQSGRVVRIIARLNVGGPSWHVMILDEGLRQHGWDCWLVHGPVGSDEASLDDVAAARGVRSHIIQELGRRVRPWSDIVALCRVFAAIRRIQPDVVHTHTAKAGALGRLAAAMYNATRRRRHRCLVVHTFHGHVLDGYFGRVGNWAVRQAERALARISDRIVTISPRQRDDIVTKYRIARADQTIVVPLGLELDALTELPTPASARQGLGLPLDAIVIGMIGRLAPVKQPLTLIDAFATVAARFPNARLLVVGDGELRSDSEADVRRRGLSGRVIFTGWRHDLRDVYAAVDIVALASRNEGTPVALIEALAAGRAVVATDVGGVPDVITHGVTGILTPADNVAALAEALSTLIARPDDRARLGAAGRERVLDRYRPGRLVADIQSLYHEGLEAKRGVPIPWTAQ
jgi:glycosyltransferase involved in cell wall biosynthesis